jgi:hypothetical protein
LKLVLIIFNISYFLGFFWYIFCELNYRLNKDKIQERTDSDFSLLYNLETFYSYNGLDENSDIRNAIIVVYYAFTSLSTVGFGDFNPRSDSERLVCSFILLFGVAIFSYIMGEFITMITNIKKYDDASGDDGD